MEDLKSAPLPMRCLALTAQFETGAQPPKCFGVTTGNSDGQGISWGAIQFALRPGSLTGILRAIDARDRGALDRAFGGAQAATLRRVLVAPPLHQLEWSATIQPPAGGRRLNVEWQRGFEALGLEPAAQAAQVDAAKSRFDKALEMCVAYGLWSERGAAFMFDVVVQHGSLSPELRAPILAEFDKIAVTDRAALEVERMRIIGRIRSAVTRPQFRDAVLARRLCVATGAGSVHGTAVDLEHDFGIGLRAREDSHAG